SRQPPKPTYRADIRYARRYSTGAESAVVLERLRIEAHLSSFANQLVGSFCFRLYYIPDPPREADIRAVQIVRAMRRRALTYRSHSIRCRRRGNLFGLDWAPTRMQLLGRIQGEDCETLLFRTSARSGFTATQ